MREFKLDFYFRPEVRETYRGLFGILQADVDRRVEFLCQTPEPDDEVVFAWPEEGPNVFVYYDDAWLLIFAVIDDGRVLEIWTIEPAGRLGGGA